MPKGLPPITFEGVIKMQDQRMFSAGLLLSIMILATVPAGAVTYDGEWHLNRYNTGGTSYAVMRLT